MPRQDMRAWYRRGEFDLANKYWADASGNGYHATLYGSGHSRNEQSGNGATAKVVALRGTTSSKVSFGRVIASPFTICSVTRYAGSSKHRILDGKQSNWLHGHHHLKRGVAYYEGWKTSTTRGTLTDWLVMCAAGGSSMSIIDGNYYTVGTQNQGNQDLYINDGRYNGEYSDFAIAELVTWSRALSRTEMFEASTYLHAGLTKKQPTTSRRRRALGQASDDDESLESEAEEPEEDAPSPSDDGAPIMDAGGKEGSFPNVGDGENLDEDDAMKDGSMPPMADPVEGVTMEQLEQVADATSN